jgi:hypothetical protein
MAGTRQQRLLKTIYIVAAAFCFMVFIHPSSVLAAHISLAWDSVDDPALAGYRLYYGTASRSYTAVVDVGTATDCSLENLTDRTTYFVAVTAVDISGLESDYSNEVTVSFDENGTLVPIPAQSQGSMDAPLGEAVQTPLGAANVISGEVSTDTSEGGGGCFIATAAFGSYIHPQVRVLRAFRDKILMRNRSGRIFVAWYYRNSPAVAAVIAEHPLLRVAVRVLLLPVIGLSHVCLVCGLGPSSVLLIVVLLPIYLICTRMFNHGRYT